MPDTTLRQITMLGLVPRRPPGITTAAMRNALAKRDFNVDIRTIQRDLVKLSGPFPLTCDESGQERRWHWAPYAEVFSLPGHDPYSALTWHLIERHLEPLLPRTMAREAEPHFRAARAFLEHTDAGRFRRWIRRVRILPRSMKLQPPDIAAEVIDAVYQALLEKCQLSVSYRGRGRNTWRDMTLHPLALIVRDSIHYLVATVWDFDDPRQFVLHRMRKPEILDEPASETDGFDLDEYISQGGFDYAHGQQIELVARFDAFSSQALLETAISPDQRHRKLDDGWFEFRATILDSEQLRWWLMGFGSGVEVVSPLHLRDFMRKDAEALTRLYRKS